MEDKIIISLTRAELIEVIKEAISTGSDKKSEDNKASLETPIDRKELMKRLNITECTVIKWEKKKIIPVIRIGRAVRYDWHKVMASLEKQRA